MSVVDDIAMLAAALGPDERLLGLDLGEKTIGMAISDAGFSIASPVGTIRRRKFTEDARALFDLGRQLVALDPAQVEQRPRFALQLAFAGRRRGRFGMQGIAGHVNKGHGNG